MEPIFFGLAMATFAIGIVAGAMYMLFLMQSVHELDKRKIRRLERMRAGTLAGGTAFAVAFWQMGRLYTDVYTPISLSGIVGAFVVIAVAFLVLVWAERTRTESFRRRWEKTADRASWLEWAKAQPEMAGPDRPQEASGE